MLIPLLALSLAAVFLIGSSPKFRQAPTLPVFDTPTSPPSPALKVYSPPANNQASPGQAESPSATPRPQPTHNPTPMRFVPSLTPQPALPEEHHINISGHTQFFSIDCEASAAVDWAAYYGTAINEYEFQFKIPSSDNPEYGFVGSVNGPWGQTPPYAYGVYAGPVADVLHQYGVQAIAVRHASLDLVKTQIAKDNPVIAWVIGNMETSPRATYTDEQGRQVIVAPYEHVVILTGYNDQTGSIRYISNGRFFETPYEVFLNSWSVLENMAIIHG